MWLGIGWGWERALARFLGGCGLAVAAPCAQMRIAQFAFGRIWLYFDRTGYFQLKVAIFVAYDTYHTYCAICVPL